MKNIGLLAVTMLVLSAALTPSCALAAEGQSGLKDGKEKASYGIGMMFGSQIKNAGFEVDVELIATAIKEVLAGKETKMTEQEAREAINAHQTQYRQQAAERNKKLGAAFLADNKQKAGIKTHTVTLADGKTAEMQYKVITEGSGAKPSTNDTVSVNYRGTLIDGKEFDSSAKRGQPAKFPVGRVVRGWTEGLQMMNVGSKWELYIPSELAYGDNGMRGIEPGSTLIFEVELLGIEPPPPPPPSTSQPLTSDIIRVPSAEEMKKGAKPEVIKQEDLEKRIKEEKEKAEKDKAEKK